MGSFNLVGFSGKDWHVTRLRALVVALALCAVLGCEDEPTPDIADPTTSSSAASPSETESSPTTSPTPEVLTPEETVRAWVDARNQALQDGDTSGAEAMSAPDCETCENLLAPIREVYANGGHFETKGWRVVAAKETKPGDSRSVVSAGLRYGAGTTVPSAGAEPVSYSVERHIARFTLTKAEAVWLVASIVYLS